MVARASGRSLSTFLNDRLFGPLGMKDTGFSVPASELARLGGCYQFNHGSGKLELFDGTGRTSDWSRPAALESGAGGLASTADDYFALCRMLLNGGVGASEARGRCRREQSKR